jgi:hypothetical protein
MNRLKRILNKNAPSIMRKLQYDIRNKLTGSLSDEEIKYAVVFLEGHGNSDIQSKCIDLWLALLYSKESNMVIRLAIHLLENAEFIKKNKDAHYLKYVLSYVLSKTKDQTIIDAFLERFCNANCSTLRMVAAEHIIALDAKRGLYEMLKILPIVGCDHTTSDSIGMWLGEKGNKYLKADIQKMLEQSKESGDTNSAEWYEWAISMCP